MTAPFSLKKENYIYYFYSKFLTPLCFLGIALMMKTVPKYLVLNNLSSWIAIHQDTAPAPKFTLEYINIILTILKNIDINHHKIIFCQSCHFVTIGNTFLPTLQQKRRVNTTFWDCDPNLWSRFIGHQKSWFDATFSFKKFLEYYRFKLYPERSRTDWGFHIRHLSYYMQ